MGIEPATHVEAFSNLEHRVSLGSERCLSSSVDVVLDSRLANDVGAIGECDYFYIDHLLLLLRISDGRLELALLLGVTKQVTRLILYCRLAACLLAKVHGRGEAVA